MELLRKFLLVIHDIHGLKCETIWNHPAWTNTQLKLETWSLRLLIYDVGAKPKLTWPSFTWWWPGGVRLSGLPGAKEDNLPREKLWLQTKFTALRGQDPRRIPYDPKARQGSTTGPWLTHGWPCVTQRRFFSHYLEVPEFDPYLPWPAKILEFISWGLFPGAIGHSSGTVHPKIFAKSGHLLSWLLGDAFAHAHLGRELGGGNL